MRDQEIIDFLSPLFGGIYKVLSTDCVEDRDRQIEDPIFWEASRMLIDYLKSGLSNSASLPAHLVDWIDSHILDRLVEYRSENTHASLMTLCMYNNLNLIKWVVENIPVDLTYNWYCYFRWACSEGCLDTAKYLYSKHPEIDLTIDRNYSMSSACEGGYLETVEWLESVNPDTVCFSALRSSLAHPKILRFLLSKKLFTPDEVDKAFRFSCEDGYTESVKILYSLYPDIMRPNFALILAVKHGRLEIVRFLVSKVEFDQDVYLTALIVTFGTKDANTGRFLASKVSPRHQIHAILPPEFRP